jgi:guanylate kinase
MENKLKHLEEFQKALENYSISDASKQILLSTKLALMVGPTSCGRNTVIRELVKHGGYQFLVSDTTRAMRMNDGVMEQNGVEYWFRSEEDVLADLKAGTFLEAAIIHAQQVSGVSMRELQSARDHGAIGTTDIEIVGVDNIMAINPSAHAIFVLPPSFDEWQNRLHHRGAMAPAEKRRRMESAVEEFAHALEVDYYRFVINDTIEHAVSQVDAITSGERNDAVESQGRALATDLLEKTQKLLTTL